MDAVTSARGPPVPDTAIVCGLLVALSVIVNKATRVPIAFGLKTSVMVHDAPAANTVPQVLLEMLKSPGSVLVKTMLLIGTAAELVFVSVADFDPLVLPRETLAQLRLDGLTVRLPTGATPVPERATVWGLLVAESTKLRVAVRVPAAAVLKRIVTVQLARAARLEPHVLLAIAKSEALAPAIAMLLTATEVAVPLLNIADNVLPLEPAYMLPNARFEGLAATMPIEVDPVPESATFCGLVLAESIRFNVAVRVPADSGVKPIVTVQVACAARLDPQVLLEIVKSVALLPEMATLLIAIETEPPFVNVADFDPPELPRETLPQPRLDGLTVALAVEAIPSPESATFCGLLLAESIKLKVAIRVPVESGLKRMVTEQLALAARLVPQVLLEMMNSAALVPVIATLLMAIETEPPFVKVTDFDPPTLPSATLAQLRLDGLAVAAAKHFDPQINPRTISVTRADDLRNSYLRFGVFEIEAQGIRNSNAIKHFMDVPSLRRARVRNLALTVNGRL